MTVMDEVFRLSREYWDPTFVLGQGAWREILGAQIVEYRNGLEQSWMMSAAVRMSGQADEFADISDRWREMIAHAQKALENPPEGAKLLGCPVIVDPEKPDFYVGIKR